MRDFDINSIGKEMPYKAPSKEFFDSFTEEMLKKTAQKPASRSLGSLAPVIGVITAIAAVLVIYFTILPTGTSMLDDEQLAESFDSYLSSLTDEQFNQLYTESTYQEDFYANLPNN